MNNLQNKIIDILIETSIIFSLFFFSTNIIFAEDTYYVPGETIVIGEFIYNDDYTPTTDDCTISIYPPGGGTALVDEVTMIDDATGWHYHSYITPETEGKYPTYITCGTLVGGDLLKLDKSFILKNPEITSAELTSAVSPLATSAELSASEGVITTAIANLNDITAADVWSSPTRSLSTFGTLVADIWANTTRTITGGIVTSDNMLAASDIWTYGTRNLTDATLTVGSLAKLGDLSGLATATNVTDATSPLATSLELASAVSPLATSAMLALVKTNTDTIDWTDITTIKNNAATLITEIGTGNITGIKTNTDTIAWTDITGIVTDTGLIKAKTDTIAWANVTDILTDTGSIAWSDVTGIKAKTDTILWTDIATLATASGLTTATSGLATASGLTSAVAPLATSSQLTAAVVPLATSANVTSSTSTLQAEISAIPLNVWNYTTRTLTSFGTLVADVWNAVTRTLTNANPPQVIINSISDNSVPSISANVTITNEGLSEYEYQYEWCVVSDIDEDCGDPNNIFHGLAAKLIGAQQDFNTILTATVPDIGDYNFKLLVHYGTEFSEASRSFEAITAGGGAGGAGGGGGGGTGATEPPAGTCGRRSDFNCDTKINSIDFSILLYYWKAKTPFNNQYVDINKDNRVDSVDFSILLYEWGK